MWRADSWSAKAFCRELTGTLEGQKRELFEGSSHEDFRLDYIGNATYDKNFKKMQTIDRTKKGTCMTTMHKS